jgi:hypothetical protein
MEGEKKKSKRSELALGMKAAQFKTWEVGSNYKCEKLLGSGSYG